MSKWNSRILFMAISGIATVLSAALADGVVTTEEFIGIVVAVATATGGFAHVNAAEKKAGK